MQLHFMPAALSHWDELDVESSSDARVGDLALSFFSNERPLHGAAGLADWRLYGQLSRLIMAGHCAGDPGENLMLPAGPRLPFERIFLFGLGEGNNLRDEDYMEYVEHMRESLRRAGSTAYAVQAPGRATGLIAAKRAVELWLELAKGSSERVTFIDSKDAYKEMSDLLVREGDA